MKRFSIIILIALLSGMNQRVYSQEVDDRGEFFSNDFANSSEVTGLEKNQDDDDLYPSSEKKEPVKPTNPNRPDRDRQNPIVEKNPQSSTQARITQPSNPLSVSEIELYVNAFNKAHLERVLGIAIRLASQKDITINIKAIGPTDAVDKGMQKRLENAGIKVIAMSYVPEELPSEESPLWILKTPKGSVALEGIMSPGVFISSRATFMKPEMEDGFEAIKSPEADDE